MEMLFTFSSDSFIENLRLFFSFYFVEKSNESFCFFFPFLFLFSFFCLLLELELSVNKTLSVLLRFNYFFYPNLSKALLMVLILFFTIGLSKNASKANIYLSKDWS